MNRYVKAMRSYADFSGRASRSDYWIFSLFFFILYLIALFIDFVFNLYSSEFAAGPLSLIVVLAHLIPSVSLLTRRIHDTGHTGWWTLFTFIPVIGFIAALYFLFKRSQPGANAYGPALCEASSYLKVALPRPRLEP